MNDKAYELVSKLFVTYNFNGSQWEVDAQMDSYYNCLKQTESDTGKEYDYDKMYRIIEKEYKYKTVPPKAELLKWQKRCIKYNYDTSKDGQLVLALCYKTVEDGHYELKEVREYVMSNNEKTKQSESEIKYNLLKAYDEVVFKHYKEGSSLIGYKVFIPKTYDEMGEVTEYEVEKIA